MEIREIDDRKEVCLLLTQWRDLGPGLDPEDDLWRSQADRVLPITLKASDMVEDPRMRFEEQFDGAGSNSSQFLSEEQMFGRNLSFLRGQRYRAVMRRCGDWWYLQEEPKVKKSQCIVN
ncbi:hypothetical protein N7509_000614 [Penicillium cosmopolitanum]|uniref:Uncharacterized protein n=1 Tax=Penicillium cosmopolitanum TaxID=1131564 RepID=A0A9X0BE91_9EURO|nr:uncharacterized protein N7509_000614 [Penicillium cosmopolitanum]KAJ5413987.1 hypothetical protein N7509_000614 [Penicillium cosmopolitanum]